MPRDLKLITVSLIIWGVGEGVFFYFQPLYLEQLGADPALIGLILGAYGVAMTVTHVPAGFLADRIGRKPLMGAAWLMGTLAAWIMALSRSLPIFVIGMLIYGLTLFVSAPLNSYITVGRGRLPVERAITYVIAGFYFGAVVGPLIGGWIGQGIGLQAVYLLAACLFVVSTVVFLFVRSQPIDQQAREIQHRPLHRNRRYLLFMGVVFLATYAMYLPQPLAPNYLQSFAALSLEQLGLLYSISGLGIVVLSLLLGLIPAQIGYVICQLLVSGFSFILWTATGMPAYALGFFMLGGYRVSRSLAPAQVKVMVGRPQLGLAYGWTDTISMAATVISPPLAGMLFGIDPALIFVLSIILTLIAVSVNLVFYHRSARSWQNQGYDAGEVSVE